MLYSAEAMIRIGKMGLAGPMWERHYRGWFVESRHETKAYLDTRKRARHKPDGRYVYKTRPTIERWRAHN